MFFNKISLFCLFSKFTNFKRIITKKIANNKKLIIHLQREFIVEIVSQVVRVNFFLRDSSQERIPFLLEPV